MHTLLFALALTWGLGTAFAESAASPGNPAQPDIFWTMEFHNAPEEKMPDYRPDDKGSFYKLDNPFLPMDQSTLPFASVYGGENVFLGNGRVDNEILGSLDVMGGSFSKESFYSTEGNAFLPSSREATNTNFGPSAESEAYYDAVDKFITTGNTNSADPWPTLE